MILSSKKRLDSFEITPKFRFLLTEPGAKAISSRLGQEHFHPSQTVSDLFLAEANGDIDATILIM